MSEPEEGTSPHPADEGPARRLRALRVGVVGLAVVLFVTPLGWASWVSAKVFFGVWAATVLVVALVHARPGSPE